MTLLTEMITSTGNLGAFILIKAQLIKELVIMLEADSKSISATMEKKS